MKKLILRGTTPAEYEVTNEHSNVPIGKVTQRFDAREDREFIRGTKTDRFVGKATFSQVRAVTEPYAVDSRKVKVEGQTPEEVLAKLQTAGEAYYREHRAIRKGSGS